ncbi:MAG: S41 family peptidase [Acidobacteria bacterium]|nr:S41 family peptidase [Acidobacteriota bacterium]
MKLINRYLLLVMALLLPLVFAGAHTSQRFSGGDGNDYLSRKKITTDLLTAMTIAEANYADKLDFDKVYKASILGMLHTLDPHSSYFDRKEWEEFQNDQRSRYSGIGAYIAQRNDKVYITSPFNDTPAYRAGLRYGDQIVEISGESTLGLSSNQVSTKLIGPEGTPVTVKVKRAGVAEPLEFKLVRRGVPLPSIPNYGMIGNGIGYINLFRGFNFTTTDEMRSAIADLKSQGMTQLILDIRGNRGGLVDQANKVASLFLYSGQKVVSMRGRNQDIFPPRDLGSRNSTPDEYPLVVLIDRGSASASEILAGALQDHDRARLVGENSFGKGLVQNVFPLRDGSGLTLTTGHYYTPSGRMIQRAYENRSFYDYIFHSDRDTTKRTEEKRTDAGRIVYGGGGIDPDVAVKPSPKEIDYRRTWWEPTFQFARQLVNGQIAGLPEFKIDHAPDHSHRLAASDYVINDKVMAAFKKYLADYKKEYKDAKADDARLLKDMDWVRRQIRYEVITAAYGQEVASQVLLEGDVQVQRAIAELPNAKIMAEEFRKERAALKTGGTQKD